MRPLPMFVIGAALSGLSHLAYDWASALGCSMGSTGCGHGYRVDWLDWTNAAPFLPTMMIGLAMMVAAAWLGLRGPTEGD